MKPSQGQTMMSGLLGMCEGTRAARCKCGFGPFSPDNNPPHGCGTAGNSRPKGVDEELWEENGGVSWFHVWSSRNLNSPTTQQQRSKRRYVATVVTIGQVELSSL